MARAAPSAEGCVMWCASDDIPNPAISPRIFAPRARARSTGSRTSTAAPSPRIRPAPVARKRTAGIRRNHAHGFPGFQKSHRQRRFAAAGDGHFHFARADHPERLSDGVIGGGTRRRDGEHRSGDSVFERNAAGAGVAHRARDGQRRNARLLQRIEMMEPVVLGGFSAARAAQHDRGSFPQLRRKLDSRRSRRLRARPPRRTARTGPASALLFLRSSAGDRNPAPRPRWGIARLRARPGSAAEWRSGPRRGRPTDPGRFDRTRKSRRCR